MKPIDIAFSKKLRSLRKEYGYTQAKLAELSGIECTHIQRLEGKKPTDIRLSTIEKLAKAFKISLSEFLNF